MNIIESMHGVRTKPIAYAEALLRILNMNNIAIAALAVGVDRTVPWVRRKLKLNDLIPEAKSLVNDGSINETNAYRLACMSRNKQKRFIKHAKHMACDAFAKAVKKELAR